MSRTTLQDGTSNAAEIVHLPLWHTSKEWSPEGGSITKVLFVVDVRKSNRWPG